MTYFLKNINELKIGEIEKAIQNEPILFFENNDIIELKYQRKKTNNGSILYYYVDNRNQIHGILYAYYPNNELLAIASYLNNKICGKCEIYDMKGNKRSVIDYKNGILDGNAYYYEENGQLIIYEQYKNGKLNGSSKRWCIQGCCMNELYYENDIIKQINTYVNHIFIETLFLTEKESKEYDLIGKNNKELFYPIYTNKKNKIKCNYHRKNKVS